MDGNEATKGKMAMSAAGGFMCGTILLISSSYFQKLLADFYPSLPEEYLVPLFYGGIVGSVLGMKFLQISLQNKALAARNKEVACYLPICSYCKAIREPGKDPKDKSSWLNVEDFLSQNTTSRLTHSICPKCVQEIYPQIYDEKYSGSNLEK